MSTVRRQLRQPRLADLVAGQLRERILDGAIPDGSALAPLEALLAEFRVSGPSMREALRILEAEGLVSVRRGNLGGAIVHRPTPEHAAYTLALVLQAGQVALEDVGRALGELEPLCAMACARRADRAEAVVPALRRLDQRAAGVLDDPIELTALMNEFHEQLIARCGNATLGLVAGAVESLWLTHVREWAIGASAVGGFPPLDERRRELAVHERITDLVAEGAEAEVGRVVREHFDPSRFWTGPVDPTQPVRAAALHGTT